MRDAEDEAFEELSLKQGRWIHTSGSRKRQIMEKMEQAFPNPHRTDMTGMTLRDYFAAKAMQSILSEDPDYHTKYKFLDLADFSYQCADAMMKEREQNAT